MIQDRTNTVHETTVGLKQQISGTKEALVSKTLLPIFGKF
jgi:hypothetical protein